MSSDYNFSEESSICDSESITSSNIVRVSQDLTKLFNANKYYEVLTLIPSLNKYLNLPASARIIISLTLFKLGRIDAALRELSLTIEISTNQIEKEKLIKYLIQFFKDLGMCDCAVSSFQELIDMVKLDLLITSDNEAKCPQLQERVNSYESELNRFIKILKQGELKLINKTKCIPLHEQAEAYMKFDGRLNDYSLGRCCIITKRLVDEAILSLNSWKSSPTKIPTSDPLHKIFTALKYFGPLYVFDRLKEKEKLVSEFVTYEIDRHPEINYSIDPRLLTKQLYRWNHKSSSRTLMSLCGLIIKHQIILGFLKFLDEDYSGAINLFKWVLNFFASLDKKFTFFTNKNEYLSSVTKRVVNLLLCQCYNLGELDCNEQELGCILTALVGIDDINITTEYLSGRLSSYFISCGFIYERLSMITSTKMKVEDEEQMKMATCSRYSKAYLGELMRKYLIAATLKAHDDPSSLKLYDRVIWGMLLYGGIHLKTFWFFVQIRNFLMIENDYGPLTLSDDQKYNTFACSDLISKYNNGWEIVYKIHSLWDSLNEEENENIWDINKGNTFLIPQIFEYIDRLLLVDLFYDEHSSYHGKLFIFMSDYQIKHKLKGHIKLPGKVIQEHLEFSKELIYLWSDSFMRYHGSMPDFILNLVQNFE